MLRQLKSLSLYSRYSPQQIPFPMPPSKARLLAAARARAGRQQQRQLNKCSEVPYQITLESSSESEDHSESPGSGDEETGTQTDSETDEIEELAGPALMQSLEHEMEREETVIRLFDKITHSMDGWKRAESHIRGHYTGNSERTQRREKRRLEAKAKGDEKMCRRHAFKYSIVLTSSMGLLPSSASAAMFRSYFIKEKCPNNRTPNILPISTNDIPKHTQALALSQSTCIPDPAPAHALVQSCTPRAMGPINGVTAALVPGLVPALGRIPEVQCHTPSTRTGHSSTHAPTHTVATSGCTPTVDAATTFALASSPLPAPNLSDATENVFDGYLSDMEGDVFVLEEELDDWYDENHAPLATNEAPIPAEHETPATECSVHKRRRLDVPVREQ
jgi:hypothetical protein